MTHLQTLQLTADGRDTAKLNDLVWRIGKLSAAYVAETDPAKRSKIRALGARLIAQRDELRRG